MGSEMQEKCKIPKGVMGREENGGWAQQFLWLSTFFFFFPCQVPEGWATSQRGVEFFFFRQPYCGPVAKAVKVAEGTYL